MTMPSRGRAACAFPRPAFISDIIAYCYVLPLHVRLASQWRARRHQLQHAAGASQNTYSHHAAHAQPTQTDVALQGHNVYPVPCTLYPVPSKGTTRPPFSAPSQAPATFPAEPSQFSSTQSKSIEPPAAASLLVPPGAALAMSSILLPVPCTSSSLLPVPCTSSSLLYTSSNGGRASEA